MSNINSNEGNTDSGRKALAVPDERRVMRFLRKWLQCKLFGTHCDVTRHDDRGIAGEWTCNDCGHREQAIKWPKPPPMPKCKSPREPCKLCGS